MRPRTRFPLLRTAFATAVVAIAAIGTGCATPTRPGAGAEEPLYLRVGSVEAVRRVGTVDRTELLLAWYGSEAYAEAMDRQAAQQRSNRPLREQLREPALEPRGPILDDAPAQDREMMGTASLERLKPLLEPIFSSVAKQANVDAIYEEGGWKGEPVGFVDVTTQVVSRLKGPRSG
ncbi:MAG: hypothetical protein KDA22_04430 [Phycisphaerales bacterium]|nr:hypothetical protein [Phycisphaerales bacterium]